MNGYEEKRELFLRAVRYIHERAGDEAVLEAFGDMEAMDRLWLRPVPKFRAGLRARAREVLSEKAA